MNRSECCGAKVYDDTDICSECLEHCDIWEDQLMEVAIKRTREQIYKININELIEHIKIWHSDCKKCEVADILNSSHYTVEKLINAVYETDSELFDSFIEKKVEHDKECNWKNIDTINNFTELVFRN